MREYLIIIEDFPNLSAVIEGVNSNVESWKWVLECALSNMKKKRDRRM